MFSGTFIGALILPFSIAHIMHHWKCLTIYGLSLGTFLLISHYDRITTPIQQRGHGLIYAIGTALFYVVCYSVITGVISKAIVLFLASRGYEKNAWLATIALRAGVVTDFQSML